VDRRRLFQTDLSLSAQTARLAVRLPTQLSPALWCGTAYSRGFEARHTAIFQSKRTDLPGPKRHFWRGWWTRHRVFEGPEGTKTHPHRTDL